MKEEPQRYRDVQISRFSDGRLLEKEVPLVAELPVTIYLNGREIITFLASDDALEFLAAGFLASEGIIERREDILDIAVDPSRTRVDVSVSHADRFAEQLVERRTVTSGCGKGTTFYHALDAMQVKPVTPGPVVTPEEILRLMTEMHRSSSLYRLAGGVHNAALCDIEKILIFRDDIGRHNAVDKIHGECFLNGVFAGDKLLLTTGRISSEILIKAGKLGVPLLASRSTPTTLALDLAERVGITVVGRVRGGELSVFSRPERVKTTA